MPVFLIFCFFSFFLPVLGIDECKPHRCRKGGPIIKFPFRNKYLHAEKCGYPGFDVFCDNQNEAVLQLPSSVQLTIKSIVYSKQQVELYDPQYCLPLKLLQSLNLSASPFHFVPDDSLEKFISQSSGSMKMSLGWQKLRDIAIGIAKGMEYLHMGCDQQILHFDIKPHNILLDQNFNPKICDFGLAKLCSKEQSGVTMTDARGTMGYIAPEVMSRTFGKASYKSDVYSFGMLLLEMVGGRENSDPKANTSQVYFPQWVYDRLDLNVGEDFWSHIEEGGDRNIARRLTIVGLWCIQWSPASRPSMKQVVQMFEGDEESLAIPPNPFPATNHVPRMIPGNQYQAELTLMQETEYNGVEEE